MWSRCMAFGFTNYHRQFERNSKKWSNIECTPVTTAATIDGDASNFAVRLIGDDLLIHCDLPSQPTFYRVRGFLSASRVAFTETIEETGGIGLADVICSICLDTYNDPRTLTCGHSFCNQCLTRLSAKVPVVCSAIRCPNCRNPSKIPTTGLPMNYGLKGQHWNVTPMPTEILILEAIEMLEKVRRSQTFDQRCSTCRLACVDEELWRCIDCDRGSTSICANCVLQKHNNHVVKREVDFKNTKAIEEIRREFVNNTKAQFDRFSEELNEKFRLLVLEKIRKIHFDCLDAHTTREPEVQAAQCSRHFSYVFDEILKSSDAFIKSLEESLFNEHDCDLKASAPTITESSAI
ncbi:RING-type domain-containing protein [Aphelenchoides besseyi]|nr:RING-type domain-containing protein [Aphelenchoides besseyi]